MRKIKKQDYTKLTELSDEVNELHQAITAITVEINEQISSIICDTEDEAGRNLDSLLDSLKTAKEEISELTESHHEEMEGYFDDRSEDWSLSETGESYREWVSQWSGYNQYVSNETVSFNVSGNVESGGISLIVELEDHVSLPDNEPE